MSAAEPIDGAAERADDDASRRAHRNLMIVSLLGLAYRFETDADQAGAAFELTQADPTQFRLCRAIVQGISGDTVSSWNTLAGYIDKYPGDNNAKKAMKVVALLSRSGNNKSLPESRLRLN